MKLSSITGGFVLVLGLFFAPGVPATSAALATARDYSFTVSTTQPWTDTGVDLQAGEVLEINAGPGQACDPAGVDGPANGGAALPVLSAPAGALIARLHSHGVPLLIGSAKQIKVEEPGHLFLGVNASAEPPCSGSFAVKIHVASGTLQAMPGAGNALSSNSTTPSSTPAAPSPDASKTAGSSAGTQAAPASGVQSKLASAAQVFLSGQFGNGAAAAPTSSSAVPAGNDVVPATSNATSAASPPVALKVSPGSLDSGLQKDLDGLPRRVNDQFNHQGDMVNFVLVGSDQQVKDALQAAGWRIADTDNREAVLKAVLETYQKKDYLQMPMSTLYLFGRKQDYGYELAQAYSVVASRHHFRIWKAPVAWNGQTMWAGAGTHDIGFEKDQRNGKVTHKIDPAVDGERDNIGQTLQASGKVKSLYYYLPADSVQDARNATGGGYHSDGRILVVVLQ